MIESAKRTDTFEAILSSIMKNGLTVGVKNGDGTLRLKINPDLELLTSHQDYTVFLAQGKNFQES